MLAGGHAQNALPQSASANVNCRIFPGVKIEDVRQTLQDVVGSEVEVKLVGEPMSSDASPLRQDVVARRDARRAQFYPGVPIVPQQASGATDGLVFRAAGIPTYGVDGDFHRRRATSSRTASTSACRAVVLRQPRDLVPAGQGPRGQAREVAAGSYAVNTTAEPLGTLELALAHATRLLDARPARPRPSRPRRSSR